MSANEELEKRLEQLGQAIAGKKSMTGEVMGRIDSLPTAPSTKRRDSHAKIWRTIMNTRFVKYAAAAVVVIGVIGLFAWLTGGNGGASVALAEAVRQIREAETFTFTMTINPIEAEEPTILQFMYMEPGRIRIDSSSNTVFPTNSAEGLLPEGSIWIGDSTRGTWLILDPIKNRATTLEGEGDSSPAPSVSDIDQLLESLPTMAERELGIREIDGRKAMGFVVRMPEGNMTFAPEVIVWIDQESKLPIRIEMEATKDQHILKSRVTITDIQFNKKLDESLFSLDPPARYATGAISPELERLRQMALRTKSAVNIHILAKGCVEYSKDHNGEWPDSLEELLGKYGIAEKHFSNPNEKDRRIGYVYLKPEGGSAGSGQLLIYEAHAEWKDGISAWFAEGYVQFITDEEEFKKLLEQATAE